MVDDIFTFSVTLDITMNPNEDPEPQNAGECRQRNDWLKWEKNNLNRIAIIT